MQMLHKELPNIEVCLKFHMKYTLYIYVSIPINHPFTSGGYSNRPNSGKSKFDEEVCPKAACQPEDETRRSRG